MSLINKNDIFLLEVLVKRNFSSKYKDSILGILWSIIRPLLVMIILTIIFSTVFKGSIDNYPVYLLSGRCMFTFITGSIGVAMNSLYANKNILQKTSTPKYIFVISSIISEFLNFIITLILLILVMLITKTPFYLLIMPLSIIPIISALMLSTGISLILSIFSVYYTDIKHLWGVIVMTLMYASAIFYPMDIVPEPYRHYLLLNPVYWIIDQFRCLIYKGIIPSTSYILNSILLSAITLVFGIIIFKKFEKRVSMKF